MVNAGDCLATNWLIWAYCLATDWLTGTCDCLATDWLTETGADQYDGLTWTDCLATDLLI